MARERFPETAVHRLWFGEMCCAGAERKKKKKRAQVDKVNGTEKNEQKQIRERDYLYI
jgi:hypothetical protein